MKELVFILSLPRSGSTLLQRILKCSSEVECPAEPWVLIPALNVIEKKYEECSEYNSISSRRAYNDFINYCGKENYINALNIFYTKVVQEEAYDKVYIDKTPRYHVFADLLMEVFPDAKFIILDRNPLAVIASICNSWKSGVFDLSGYEKDLHEGYISLQRFKTKHLGNRNVMSIAYEDIVEDDFDWESVFNFLNIKFDKAYLSKLSYSSFEGKMGDQVGIKKYDRISNGSRDSYVAFFSNIIRQNYLKKYKKFLLQNGVDINFEPKRRFFNDLILKDLFAAIKVFLVKKIGLNLLFRFKNKELR
ncbi:sulfotransferase family protein [Pseudoalteromonas shioyasakiensis]|uniref:sulfotransferase family protein n=1 Tax=Pseudoalteromonas shioyasakiensis TaxID=1190813 RepID=UPI003B50258D